jgi:hypothetical protein
MVRRNCVVVAARAPNLASEHAAAQIRRLSAVEPICRVLVPMLGLSYGLSHRDGRALQTRVPCTPINNQDYLYEAVRSTTV